MIERGVITQTLQGKFIPEVQGLDIDLYINKDENSIIELEKISANHRFVQTNILIYEDDASLMLIEDLAFSLYFEEGGEKVNES